MGRLHVTALLMVAMGVGHPTGMSAQDAPRRFAITGARVVTVSGAEIEAGTVLIQDGVISGVGRGVPVPAGTWTIDGRGLTVYPGLISGLSSVGMPAPAREAGGNGGGGGSNRSRYSTGPADRPATFSWVTAEDQVTVDTAAFASWRKAGFSTVVTAPTQGFFSGHAAVVNLGAGRPRALVIKPSVAVRFNLRPGGGHRGFPSSRPGVFAYLKQSFFDAQHYADAWERYERNPRGLARPEYDRALAGLVRAARGTEPLLFPAGTPTEIRRALATAATIGARPILYGVEHGYRVAADIATAGVWVLVTLDWPTDPEDADPETDEALDVVRHRLMAPTTPARLAAARVPFAFHTEGVDDPDDILPAVRKAVDAGLDPADAVRALTLGTAQMYGIADRVGSIDEGKIANLTVTTGDLFAPDTRVRMVFVDGTLFEIDGGDDEPGDAEDTEDVSPTPASTDRELRALVGGSMRGPYRDDPVTVIQNATILPVTGEPIEGGSIVIRNGTIAAVGPEVTVPPGAHVIDATGRFVMPGIVDAHSHVAGGFNEGSVAVSAMSAVRDNLNPDDINIYRALAGGVTTMNVLHGSANPIGGQNAVLKLRWGSTAADLIMEGAPPGIKFALGENPKRDRDPDRYPATRMGVMDVIRQAFVDAQAYQAEWDRYGAAGEDGIGPRRDLKLEALAEVLRGERLVHAHSYRADEILQLIRLAEEFGFRIATFQHVLEGYKVANEIAEHGAGASTFSDWWAYKVEAYDAIPYNAAIMVEKGVSVSINSDSNEEMRHLNHEAAKTIHWGGLTERQALSLITINPARQLGVGDRIGSIEVGKDADLAIFDRHPLDNFAVVQQTFVDGKLYFDIHGDAERQRAIEAEKRALTAGKRTAPRITTEAGAGR